MMRICHGLLSLPWCDSVLRASDRRRETERYGEAIGAAPLFVLFMVSPRQALLHISHMSPTPPATPAPSLLAALVSVPLKESDVHWLKIHSRVGTRPSVPRCYTELWGEPDLGGGGTGWDMRVSGKRPACEGARSWRPPPRMGLTSSQTPSPGTGFASTRPW